MRNIDGRDLDSLGKRLRLLIGKSSITHGDETVSVTVSMGATAANQDDTMETIVRADALMYRSKEAGRNRLTAG